MIPSAFDYVVPRSLEEALACLGRCEPGTAALLAGGMSLVPALKLRFARPATLVDVGRIAALRGIEANAGGIRIGALVTHAELLGAARLADRPVFAETARVIADPQVRNRGTFGGSLAYAHPAADWPAVFLALGGEAELFGPRGARTVAAGDFFTGIFGTAIGADEILTGVRFAHAPAHAGAAYSKMRQQASGMALVGVAAQLVLDAAGAIRAASVGVTGVNAVPFRARSLEARLQGGAPDPAALGAACAAGIAEADPLGDRHASVDYRLHLLGVHAGRALASALARARGSAGDGAGDGD